MGVTKMSSRHVTVSKLVLYYRSQSAGGTMASDPGRALQGSAEGPVQPPSFRYAAVHAEREQRRRLPRAAAAAVVAFVAALLAATMMTAVEKTPLSATRISAAIKSLRNLALDSPYSQKGISWQRAGLSPKQHAPAQELHEMLAQQGSMDRFAMLEQIDVKRAMACPIGNRCRYTGVAEIEQKSTMVEYEADLSDASGKKMKRAKESSGSTKGKLTVTFDVYETNMTGCQTDTVAWAINVSECVSGDLESTGDVDGESTADDTEQVPNNRTEDHMMTQSLQIYPFVVIQDRATGAFKDYIIDRQEEPKNADIKRSLAKDLNPVIDVLPSGQQRVQVGDRGEILFRLMERDMNGKHHNTYMLKRNAGGAGVHEVQHVRSFMLDESEAAAEEHVDDSDQPNANTAPGNERAGVSNDGEPAEPETCPYQVKDITDSAGQHSRTATTKGDAVEESKDEGKLAVGKKPEDTMDMPSETAEETSEKAEQNPTESRTSMKSKYELVRESTTPEDSVCADASTAFSSEDPSSPLAQLKQTSAVRATSLVVKDSFEHQIEVPGGEGGPNDGSRERPLDLVVHNFNGPQLYSFNDDHAQYYGSQEAAEAHAQQVINVAIASHDKFEPGEDEELVRACRIDPVRGAMLDYLRNQDADRHHRHNAAIKFLGACSYVVNEHQGKIEHDILALAAQKETPEIVRDQGLLALIPISCPSLHAFRALDAIIQGEPDSPVGETAMLTMGALLRNRRACDKKTGHSGKEAAEFEEGFNREFVAALKQGDMDRADALLLAMHNSAGQVHLSAIKQGLQLHSTAMRSMAMKDSAKLALSAIGDHAENGGSSLHQELIQQLEVPLDIDVKSASSKQRRGVIRPTAVRPTKGVLAVTNTKASSQAHGKLLALARASARTSSLNNEEDFGHCADEGGTCSCTGVVRFGDAANDVWSSYQPEVDGEVNCARAIFGDPAWGAAKSCQCLEKEIDPRKCLGGEDALVCYGKRVPQGGCVRGLLGVFGGVAEAMDLGRKCQKYAYAKATATVEVYTGIPIHGLNPLSLDIIKLEGRLLLGPKCKCKPTKTDVCPKKCSKNKRYKGAKKKNRIGGHLMIMGIVYKRFGKLRLGEPYIPGKPLTFPAVPPPGFQYTDAGSPPDWGDVGPSRPKIGFCGFRDGAFETKTFVNNRHIPVRGVDGAFYWLGPVLLRLYARLTLSNGAEMGATVEFQEREDLMGGRQWWSSCSGGGRAGFGKAFISASFSFGGWADIWFFQAHLGASVRFMSLDAGFTGELLPSIPGYQSGYGKEAVVQLHPISGYVRGTIYQVVILGDRV